MNIKKNLERTKKHQNDLKKNKIADFLNSKNDLLCARSRYSSIFLTHTLFKD